METPCPSGTDLGGGGNTGPFRVSDGKVRRDLAPGGVSSTFRSRRALWNDPWSLVGAPPLHVGECVPLGHEQGHAVSPDSYGPTIVSALDEEGCRC
jgi:hypothetical protein